MSTQLGIWKLFGVQGNPGGWCGTYPKACVPGNHPPPSSARNTAYLVIETKALRMNVQDVSGGDTAPMETSCPLGTTLQDPTP